MQILSECKNKNFEPAIEWAEKNEKPLKDIQSDLLYELHEFKVGEKLLFNLVQSHSQDHGQGRGHEICKGQL